MGQRLEMRFLSMTHKIIFQRKNSTTEIIRHVHIGKKTIVMPSSNWDALCFLV